MLLVRPIMTYAFPSWFTISPSEMEKMRKLERLCLRACLNKYRTPESEYTRYYKSKIIYDEANITRIDNFCIKLTRNHINSTKRIENNPLISEFYTADEARMELHRTTGFVPPEAFVWLDRNNYIQSNNHLPILYHIKRHAFDKKILYNEENVALNQMRYCTTIPKYDTLFNYKNREKYEWLA